MGSRNENEINLNMGGIPMSAPGRSHPPQQPFPPMPMNLPPGMRMPLPPGMPPMPPMSAPGHFTPSDHISPELTHNQFHPSHLGGPTPSAPMIHQAQYQASQQQQPSPLSGPGLAYPPVVRGGTGAVSLNLSQGSFPGASISGEFVDYPSIRDQSESQPLEVTPVTLYNSERVSQLGTLISVNEHFIAYPIRNGLIRVIHQSSVNKLLLRQHQGHGITELAFFNDNTDLLLSSGTNNQIVISSIVDAIYDQPISFQAIKMIPTPAQRVKWHPTDSNKIAIVNGNVVYVTDLTNVTVDGLDSESLEDISVICGQISGQVNDIVFSPDGTCLLTAGGDGFVHVFRIAGRPNGTTAEFIHRFQPFDGEDVTSLHFFAENFASPQPGLLIGGNGNSKISLWNAPLTENVEPVCYQTVKLVDRINEDAPQFETLFDASTQFLFVADRGNPIIYVLHLAPSVNNRTPRCFDNVTEFTIAYPILSMCALERKGQSQPSETVAEDPFGFFIHLYCIQTQAIQRYHVPPSSCFLPGRAPRGSIEDEIPSIETQTVGAMTTEGESFESILHQSAAESPRATGGSPETEIDQSEEEQQHRSLRSPPLMSPSPSRVAAALQAHNLSIGTQDDNASFGGDDLAASLRSFPRSSPTSSMQAFNDESSQQYEPSIGDDTASDAPGQQTILSYLRRMEANQIQREEQFREQMRTFMGNLANHLSVQVATQVDKSIGKQIQAVLVPAMGRIVLHTMENNFMKPVQAGFQRVISEKVVPHLETRVNESLSTILPEQLENGMKDIVEKVVEDVRDPVRESFRECFQAQIIPSFQAATQKMFVQINDTFLQGTKSVLDGKVTQNQNQLQDVLAAVETLSKKIDQLATSGNVSAAGASSTSAAAAGSTVKQPSLEEKKFEENKKTVQLYLAAGNFEEAFKLALGAQNVDLVSFTCQSCDSRVVLSSRPPKLSQMLILCLVQQLGADLGSEISMKLNWLRESLLVMDPKDTTISSFVASVLQELQNGLNNVPAEAQDSQYTLLHHILNSMLASSS